MQLLQGDCLTLMQDIPDGSVDLILCDPPYGTTDCKWDSVLPFDRLWAEYNRILKPNGAAVLFAAQPFTTQLIQSNRRAFRYCWYWLKNQATGFPFAKLQPMRRVEEICVFYRRRPTYNPQWEWGQPYRKRRSSVTQVYALHRVTNGDNDGRRYPRNVLQFNTERGLHPTQKPTALLEYLVRTYTNEGDTILDNCMGSGSTGVAVQRVGGRHFIGIEQDQTYFEIARERIEKE